MWEPFPLTRSPLSDSYFATCSKNRSQMLLGLQEKGHPQTCSLISFLGKCQLLTTALSTGIPKIC